MDKDKVDWDKENPNITYMGTAITLPGDPNKMPVSEAIKALKRLEEDEKQVLNAVEFIDVHPFDGAVAFMKAMQRKYGWASPVPSEGFWKTPPSLLSVQVSYTDLVSVIWGAFKIPGVEHPMNTGAHIKDNRPQFVLHGSLPRSQMVVLKELAEMTREIIRTESIYKAKAIRLRVKEDGTLNQMDAPEFIPIYHVIESDLILNDGEAEQISTSLWTLIRHTKECQKHRIPLRRGILLEGPYGCGKTMTSSVTSKVCVDNGWTYIYLDNVKALKEALLFAQRYQPAVVFAEDIDRVVSERDETANDILNTIDGVLSKGSQVITVLTTNFVEKLDKAMLRPGRFDAVVSIRAPNAASVEKLIRNYGIGLLKWDEDLTEVSNALAGKIPAVIREVVERSKLGMISRGATSINASDLLIAARGMEAHLKLLEPKVTELSASEKLAETLRGAIFNGHGEKIDKIQKQVDDMHAGRN